MVNWRYQATMWFYAWFLYLRNVRGVSLEEFATWLSESLVAFIEWSSAGNELAMQIQALGLVGLVFWLQIDRLRRGPPGVRY
jgi:hypothetical protein